MDPEIVISETKELQGRHNGKQYRESIDQALGMIQQSLGGTNKASIVYVPIGQLIIDNRTKFGEKALDSAMRNDLVSAMVWIIQHLENSGIADKREGIDRLLLKAASNMSGANRTHMAKLLGIQRTTVQMALKKYGMEENY